MTPFSQLILALSIIIAAAKAGGYVSYRLGQPSVLGELLIGILLGPTVLNLLQVNIFTDQHLTVTVNEFAEIGVLLLMFLAGLELHISDLAKSGRVAVLAGVIGVIFPVILTAGVSLLFVDDLQTALFVGLILAATSVSISAQTLMELKVLRSRVGISLLGAAVFDDILVIILLSIFSAFALGENSSGLQLLWIIIRMVLFLALASWLGSLLLPRLSRKVNSLAISQGLAAFTIVTIMIFGLSAETMGGMAAITGAFLAGLALSRSSVKERIESAINVIAFGFFVPVFFVNIGLSTNVRELSGENLWFFIVITIVAIMGKVIGAGLGGLWGGLSRREALQLGVGMMSRGEVGLIVASVGIANGLIDQIAFSEVVGVIIITTLLTPPLLRLSFIHPKLKPPVDHPNDPIDAQAIEKSEGGSA